MVFIFNGSSEHAADVWEKTFFVVKLRKSKNQVWNWCPSNQKTDQITDAYFLYWSKKNIACGSHSKIYDFILD